MTQYKINLLSVISTPETNQIPSQEDAAFKSCGKNQHSNLLQWLCKRTLSALEKLPCTKHTDLVKAHLIQNVSTIQRSRSTYCDSNVVNMFYRLQMNASSPNWPFFLSLWHSSLSHGTWMQHLTLCFLTPSYEMLIYRKFLPPQVHFQSPQTFSKALRAYLALGQWLQDKLWQPPHCVPCFVIIHCSILGV